MTWNSTRLRLAIKQAKVWSSRLALLNKRTKLLCPEGCGLQSCVDFRPLEKVSVLRCGHTRKPQTEMTDSEQRKLIEFVAANKEIHVQVNPRIADWKIERLVVEDVTNDEAA
jgi:hypothetical protein